MSKINYYHHAAFQLESGKILPQYTLAYQTFGTLNDAKDNVVWIVHALTANSDPTEWWPQIVGASKAIDTDEYYVICANVLASHYGSTSPLSIDLTTSQPYYHSFPQLTIKDLAKTYEHLANHLGLSSIKLLVGASMGGQQAMEWAIETDIDIQRLLLIATNAVHSPYGIAINESQRLAIEADQTWPLKQDNAGLNGLIAARSIALLSYRTAFGYNSTQKEEQKDKFDDFKASSYQRYQGGKLSSRFNAFSYYLFTKAMDSHNVGRNRKSIQSALSNIKSKTTIIGITSDQLFTMEEAEQLHRGIPNSDLITVESDLGHDGFLTENIKITNIILRLLSNHKIAVVI